MMAVASMVLAAYAPTRAVSFEASPASSPLTHSGRWLIDMQGRVVIVHGFNLVNKLAPYTPQSIGFDEDDAAFLESNGFNAVRLGVIWEAVEPSPGLYDSGYVAQIKATQQILAKHHLYSLIDWHQDEYNEVFGGEGFPAWAVDTGGIAPLSPPLPFPQEYGGDPAQKAAWDHLYANVPAADGIGLADHLAAAEAYVAGWFSDEPEVLGYDIINEPSQGSLGSSTAEGSAIGPLEQKLLSAIRTMDPIHLAFYEPSIYYALSGGTSLPAFDDANAGMSFHDYCFQPSASTNPFLYQLICGVILDLYQSLAIEHVQSTQDALLNTEFGSAYPYAIEQVTELADLNMIPWINWAYCGCGDPTTAMPLDLEGIVIDPAEPLTGSNLNTAHLKALVRPYPQAIAGTPEHWFYNTTTGTFRLAWSTTSPAGVMRAPDARTVVFVPRLDYPNGYQVSVHQGTVVAGMGTQHLAIAADPGASRVRVTVWRK
jgi:endoglycosylceramidase